MAQPMSETLDKATYSHLINMIETLCKRDGLHAPGLSYTHERISWLKANYNAANINWADQQVKEYHRSQNTPYRALEGRGRSVGAKNKNRANVNSNYFDRFNSNRASADNETKETIIENTDDTEGKISNLDLSDIENKINSIRYDLNNINNSHSAAITNNANAINGVRTLVDDVVSITSHLRDKIDNIVENRPTIVELKQPDDLPNIPLGIQHMNFPWLLEAANARLPSGHHLNIWLYGPAGTGKTTAAEKIAEAFGLKFYYNGALSTAFQLTGYKDANGNYVSTAFRDAWEGGGTYLFDEIDGSMPDALLSMNGALANSIASFPDRMVPRHKDCIIIAGANTTGLGGGIEYVGAMKQNAAFLNRFTWIPWPHDNALEDALCPNKSWLARVREVRQRVATKQIKSHLITMRASIFGASLLNAGISQECVEQMTLKCGMTDAQWEMVK